MKTKAKKFSHKLLALIMAVLMAATCFTAAFTAYGQSVQDYHDSNVEYNDLAWDVLSDEQVATALLDYSDQMLAEYGPVIDNLLAGALPTSGMYFYNASSRSIGLNVGGIIKADIKVYVHSVDEIMETLESVAGTISSFKSFIGDAGNIQLGSTNGVRRNNTSSCDIIRCVLGILQKNCADYNGKDVIGELLRGTFDLGTVGNLANLNLYTLLGDALGLKSGYESNLVYNLVRQLIFDNTNWYTADEIAAFENGTKEFIFDNELLEKMTTELLDKISVLVTYNQAYSTKDDVTKEEVTKEDTSATRYKEIKAVMQAEGKTYAQAATKLGYDPNLVYSDEFVDEDGNYLNVLLFAYGSPDENGLATENTDMIQLGINDSLFGFGYQALKMAWNTVLDDTVKLIHVNNNVDRGHGSNFDNAFYYYIDQQGKWNRSNPASNYTEANVQAWAQAVYKDYKAESVEEFLGWVKHNYEFDRNIADGATGIWSDIDETTLFNKLRYSPLADLYFNMQTGPINLYFLQLGTPNLDAFFESSYSNYSSIVAAFNDALVAVVKDLFPNKDNIDGTVPTMQTTGDMTSVSASGIANITNTLVSNALKMIQYVADATDKNILNGFYTKYGNKAALTETNLEEAMIPMLVACLGQVDLGSGKLERLIHPEDWNACKDAEGIAFVALREYLSHVQPDKDYNVLVSRDADNKFVSTLEGTILPMARDALIYIIQDTVPVTGKDGKNWRVEDKEVNDENSLFDLLNSVMCYYASDYDMKNSDDRAMGVAAFLGLCDDNGNGIITTQNDIWTNIDLIGNKFLPVLGTLQYGDSAKYGHFNSRDLIYNDIILGFLDIGDTSVHESGMGGVSNFINKFLTIVSAEPIQSTHVVLTVYNVLADFLNACFGPRYSGQNLKDIVPKATSEHPFNDAVQANVLAGTNGDNIGLLQKAICNLVEFTGYGTKGVNTYPDSMLRGICFALQAVNSFLPDAINNISDHRLQLATSSFSQQTVMGASSGSYTGTVNVKNNSTGVNNAYVEGLSNTVEQLSRYYIRLKSATISGTGRATITQPTNALIAPGESGQLNYSTTYVDNGDATSSYEATVKYDVCLADGTVLYSDLETTSYQYLTGAKDWLNTVYTREGSGIKWFPESLESNDPNKNIGTAPYNTATTDSGGSGNYLNVLYPKNIVLGTSNLEQISLLGFRVRNNNGNYVNPERSIDGEFFFDNKTVYTNDLTTAVTKYSATAPTTTVNVNKDNAIPVWDKKTGDLLRHELYDISVDGGKTWDRGSNNDGYTQAQITDKVNAGEVFTQRTHVAYTLQEALNAGIIAAYHINANGLYDYMYMKTGSGTNYDTTLGRVSMRGPVDGFYINSQKYTLGRKASQYFTFMKYDGSTAVQPGLYDCSVIFYNSNNNNMIATISLYIADNKSANNLTQQYNELSRLMSNYRRADFTDTTVYDDAKAALIDALAAQSAVLTPDNALALSDKTVLSPVVKSTTSKTGDVAYVPFTTSNDADLPALIKDAAYVGGSTKEGVTYGGIAGVYYYDENTTMPIYSNVRLSDSDVSDGKDAAGMAVVKGTDGKWYLENSVIYKTEWDTTTYSAPWAKKTETPTNNYNQVQYVYRDANAEKVRSDENWVCKFPDTSYQLIPNVIGEDDNRGLYTQASDRIAYATERVLGNINTSIAQSLFDDMTRVRTGLKENNFEVITFNKMADAAKEAEKYYTVTIEYDTKGGVDEATGETIPSKHIKKENMKPADASKLVDELKGGKIAYTVATSSSLSSVQVDEYLRLFNFYMSKVVERGYIGDQLEAEILCASGNTYDKMTATVATFNEDGTVATPAVVTKGSSAAAPAYGAWSADGTLVNEGAKIYSEKSWNAYVTALAEAIDLAALGNGSYAHKDKAYFDISNKEDYKAQVSTCYWVDSTLQIAENSLTEAETVTLTVAPVEGAVVTVDGVEYTTPVAYESGETAVIDVKAADGYTLDYILVNGEKTFVDFPYTMTLNKDVVIEPVVTKNGPSGITISGTVTIAGDATGSDTGFGLRDVNIIANGEIVGKTSSDFGKYGTFEVVVPVGTTEITIQGESTVDRTVTLSGTADVTGAVIPVIMVDTNKDKNVDTTDLSWFLGAYGTEGEYSIYCDFNTDNNVDTTDLGGFLNIFGQPIVYDALALD